MCTKNMLLNNRILIAVKGMKFCKDGSRVDQYSYIFVQISYLQMYLFVDSGKGRVYIRAENFKCTQICLEIICVHMKAKVLLSHYSTCLITGLTVNLITK